MSPFKDNRFEVGLREYKMATSLTGYALGSEGQKIKSSEEAVPVQKQKQTGKW